MKNVKTLKMATCAVAVIGLSGCQSMLNTLGFNSSASSRPAMAQAIGKPDLIAGQEALRAGNIAHAIASFRLAMLDPGSQADASNGLGIAYAQLGRADLAERYFLQATRIEPKGEKYAANLMRFYESDLALAAQSKALRVQQMALTQLEEQSAKLPVGTADAPQTAMRGPIMVRTLGDEASFQGAAQLAKNQVRTSRDVIQVIQRNPASAGLALPAREVLVASASGDRPAMVVGSRKTAQYPIRINIDGAAKTAATETKIASASTEASPNNKSIHPSYPVRFEFEAAGSRP